MIDNNEERLYSVDIPTIAHRGYAKNEVENTLGAFIEAGKRNFIGIETDIYFTKDGYIICNHNNNVKDMEKNIVDCTYDEIMKVNLSNDPQKEVHVCLFKDYLITCKKYQKTPIIEFKMTPDMKGCEEVLDMIKEYYGNVNQVVFISFGREILQQMKSLREYYGYTYEICRLTQYMDQVEEAVEDGIGIDHQYNLLTEEMIDLVKYRQNKVIVWTVNEVEEVEKMKKMGVDYITTDFIDCDPKYVK